MQVRSQYKQALATIPLFEQQIAATENRISILLGRNPAPVARVKSRYFTARAFLMAADLMG